MEPALHVANALLLLSYAARDILWLRALTVIGLGVLLVHEALQPSPNEVVVAWNLAFLALNAGHAAWLAWERRPMRLTEDEWALRYTVFAGLTDVQFRALLGPAVWEEHASGSGLMQPHQPVEVVRVISCGRAAVVRHGRMLHHLDPGEFVGELGFMTGEPASAGVVADGPLISLAWPAEDLRAVLEQDPALDATFRACLGVDVAGKLKAAS